MTPWPDCAHCRFPPDRGALTAAPMTAAPATGPPPSSSSTSQSKLSPTRAARIGQREFPAAFGHFMSGSPHRQQACCWRHPPEFAWIISSPSPLCPVPMPPPLGSVDSGLTSGTGEGSFTEEQLEAVRTELGINRPIYIQYGTWIWDMLRGDLNQSRGETCIYVG